MIFYILLGLSSFFISLLGTRLVILGMRNRMPAIDLPSFRDKYRTRTPRGGGIAVVIAMVSGLLVADVNYGIVVSLLLLASVSLLADIIDIPAWVRLLVQLIAVSIPLSAMPDPFFAGIFPRWFDVIVTGGLWIGFINLFKSMDTIDGLSAAEMTCIGMGICMIVAFTGAFPNDLFAYSMVVASAGFGFYWWNRYPARIALGDAGSIPIGFILGYLLLLTVQAGYVYAALILPAYYLIDGIFSTINRLAKKSKGHYHEHALQRGRGHAAIVRYIIGVNFLLIYLAVNSALDASVNAYHAAMAYLSVCIILGFFSFKHNDRQ